MRADGDQAQHFRFTEESLSSLWKIAQMTALQYLSQYSRSRKSSTQVKGDWTFKKAPSLILKASLGLKTDGASQDFNLKWGYHLRGDPEWQ